MKEDWAERLNKKMADYSESVNPDLWPAILHRTKAFRFPWRLVAGLTIAAAMAALFFLWRDSAERSILVDRPARQLVAQNQKILSVELSALPVSPVHSLSRRIADDENIDVPVLPGMTADEPEQPMEEEAAPEKGLQKKKVEPSREEEWLPWVVPQEPFRDGTSFRLRASVQIRVSPYGKTASTSASRSFYPGNRYPLPSPGGKEPGRSPVTIPFGGAGSNNEGEGDTYNDGSNPPPSDGGGSNPPSGGGNPPRDGGDQPPGGGDDDENPTKSALYPLGTSSDKVDNLDPPSTIHRFPVQVGIRVSADINRKLALETGLTYVGFYSQTGAEIQRLHYLGIPLHLDCAVLDADRFKGYLLAGGEVYRCVAGNGPDRPWLFSWDIGAGIMYQFSRSVGIYIEPGLSHYYYTGVSEHYYTQHPFSFTLTAGVRFKLN